MAVTNFGYNQGWRVGKEPVLVNGEWQTGCNSSPCATGVHLRFVADLNGDGYQDIVGFGDEAIYRALGGPNGFGTARPMLRELVIERGDPWDRYEDIVPYWYPRMVGDVNGDGMQDLVAFDDFDIKIVRSSNLPPPPVPAAPGNPRITSQTATSISVAWDDNSNNERRFFVYFGEQGTSLERRIVSINLETTVFSDSFAQKVRNTTHGSGWMGSTATYITRS